MRRFEYTDAKSNKFWEIEIEIEVEGPSFTTRHERVEDDSVGTIAPGILEANYDLARLGDGQALLADWWARHVSARSLQALAVPAVDRRPDVYVDSAGSLHIV